MSEDTDTATETHRDATGTDAVESEPTDGPAAETDAPEAGSEDASATGRPVVAVDGLSRSFGDVDVLEDVDLTFRTGEVTTLLGPNGAGKTTLLRALAGMDPGFGGRVTFRTDAERPVGYFPQEPTFRGVFTVRETLAFYADLLAADVDLDAVLDTVALAGVADRRVDALSGGMRRLLGIGCATLGDTPLLVLDEPASGLDPKMRAHLFDVVAEVADADTAVVVSTHHVVDAATADRVVLLDRGAVVADGPPEAYLDGSLDAAAGDSYDSLEAAFLALVSDELAVQAGIDPSTDRRRSQNTTGNDDGGGA
jgi:ABC-type multidrug transport system ATPase subunit